MAEKKNDLLKISLLLFALMNLYYGIIYLFFPEFEIKSTGSEPIDPSWIRWFGGILLALSYGGFRVLRNPEHQGIFVRMIAIGALLTGLTLFYTVIFEHDGYVWHSIIPAIILIILSGLLFISLKQSKEILG